METLYYNTHSKTGDEGRVEASKYRPISLLNVAEKFWKKLIINRIFSHSLLNGNQHGFLPQKSTVDAAMVAKEFVQETLKHRNYVVIVSLDVKGAFDAAWWPSILSNLRDFRCPKNFYILTQNYFSDRIAIFTLTHKSTKEGMDGLSTRIVLWSGPLERYVQLF
jgi:hypothetical protein